MVACFESQMVPLRQCMIFLRSSTLWWWDLAKLRFPWQRVSHRFWYRTLVLPKDTFYRRYRDNKGHGRRADKARAAIGSCKKDTEYRKFLTAHSIRVLEAGHPVPDERSEYAAQALLSLAAQVRTWETQGETTLVCMLVSGGGSALLAAPAPGLSLEDKAYVTKLLLGCGATIHEMNTVRKHLSAIKRGSPCARILPCASAEPRAFRCYGR